jgi:hypothetical protein
LKKVLSYNTAGGPQLRSRSHRRGACTGAARD